MRLKAIFAGVVSLTVALLAEVWFDSFWDRKALTVVESQALVCE